MRSALLTLCLTIASSQQALAEKEPVSPERTTVTLVSGITSTHQIPVSLRQTRRDLARGYNVSFSKLRQLADLGDGFAALRFAQRLEELEQPVDPADIAHYYGIAASTGRGGAITRLIKQLDNLGSEDISASRLKMFQTIVVAYAQAGNSYAADAILRYHRSGEPFGNLSLELESILDSAIEESANAIALQLALNALEKPDPSQEDLFGAREHLLLAQRSTSLQTLSIAQNLIPLVEQKLVEVPANENEVRP